MCRRRLHRFTNLKESDKLRVFSISLQIHTKSMTTLDVKCIPVVETTIVPVWEGKIGN